MNHLEQLLIEEDSMRDHKDQDSLDELNLSYPIVKGHLKVLRHHFVDYNLHQNYTYKN
jgi:hypothetical protein